MAAVAQPQAKRREWPCVEQSPHVIQREHPILPRIGESVSINNTKKHAPMSLLLQDTAAHAGLGAELIVQRIIQRQQVAERGGQSLLHFWAQQPFLILLLGLIAAAVESVQGGARA